MRSVSFAIVSGVMLAATTGANAQNLLFNASFENQVNFDGNDVGNWNSFFGGADFQMSEQVLGPPTVDGDFVLQIGTFNTVNTFVGVTQRVGVEAGMEYEFSMFAREVIQNGIFAEYRIEWVDAGGVIIGDQFGLNTAFHDDLTSDFQEFSLTAEAPTGAVTAVAVIAVQTFGSAAPHEGFIQIDAASFSKVPAPGTLALLGLGAMGVARRRR